MGIVTKSSSTGIGEVVLVRTTFVIRSGWIRKVCWGWSFFLEFFLGSVYHILTELGEVV